MVLPIGVSRLSSGQLTALNRLNTLGDAIAQNTLRLSTLKRINSAKDDPSGLVQATLLERDLAGAETALGGITQANALLSTADTAVSGILSQLQTARGLVLASAGNTWSQAEVAANQMELNSILESIDRLGQAEFGGRRLLDGSTSFATSGVNTAEIQNVRVLKKSVADDISVDVNVTQQAAQATDSYDNSTPLASDTVLVITGSRGTTTLTLTAGASTQDIVDQFNAAAHLTGIAAAVNGSNVDLTSTEYGTDATIEIEPVEGSFVTTAGNSAAGTDAIATVNGQQVTGDGNELNVAAPWGAMSIQLDPSATGVLSSFTVTGEGLQFVVGASPDQTARIGLMRLDSTSLGNVSGRLTSLASSGANSLSSGNAATAMQILDDAISDVTQSRALIGSFQKYTLATAQSILSSSIENTSSALSAIQDVDVGLETALLANNQLLQQTAYEALTISNLNKNNVLDLLRSVTYSF